MDAEALSVISAVAIYLAGVILLALATELARALIWGIVFYVVLQRVFKR